MSAEEALCFMEERELRRARNKSQRRWFLPPWRVRPARPRNMSMHRLVCGRLRRLISARKSSAQNKNSENVGVPFSSRPSICSNTSLLLLTMPWLLFKDDSSHFTKLGECGTSEQGAQLSFEVIFLLPSYSGIFFFVLDRLLENFWLSVEKSQAWILV